jgi:hypothetical protein
MLRSLLAVVAGLCVTVALVLTFTFLTDWALGVAPEARPTRSYLILNLLGSALAGMAGGAAAMRLAPHRPHGHVIALAVSILLLSLPTLLSAPAPGQPAWYGLALSILGPVCVLAGGLLAGRGKDGVAPETVERR